MVCTVGIEALQAPACYKLGKRTPFRSGKARCLTVQAVKLQSVDEPVSRRQALQGLAMLAATSAIPQQALAAGKSAEVGRSVDATSRRSDQSLRGSCLPLNLQQQYLIRLVQPPPWTVLLAAIFQPLVPLGFRTLSQTNQKLL
jgi:hypothetical protein